MHGVSNAADGVKPCQTALSSPAWSPCWCSGMIGRSGCVLWSDPTHGGAAVTFNEVLSQTIAMLHQHGRVSYRALKRQFAIPDDYLEDLTDAILFAYPQVREEEGRGLVWTGDTPLAPRGAAGAERAPAPVAYTPPYLAEKILTSRSLLAGERKQVTVLFADLKAS